MSKHTNKNKNTHKKKLIFETDLSNNNLNNLLDVKNIKNPIISPLQRWKNDKFFNNKKVSFISHNLNQKNLNIKKHPIDMSLDKIIDLLREERKTLSEKNLTRNMEKISNTLDDNSNNQLLLMDKNDNLNVFMKKTNNNFDMLFKNPNNKSKNFYFKSPPLFPQIYHNKKIEPIMPLMKPLPPPPPIKRVTIEAEIESLSDILDLIEKYPLSAGVAYNINMRAIHNIKEPLEELNSMIGMDLLKNNIVDQIIYFMQDLHLVKNKNEDFMHTVIYGPPGTGKTEIAKIIGKIFCKMGLLKNNIFRKATRSDLIAGYLGQTALKTRDVVRECLGGVLFIDEAYALGNSEKRDSFAKECIDTLCESLSDNKSELMVIIAGYEKDLDKCFFAYNQGLNSRFPWRFKTDDYSASDLNLIFQKKVKDAGWSMKEEFPDSWFEEQKDYFKYYGRDMETLFAKTKIAHSRRVFCKEKSEKTKLIKRDLEKGFAMFIDNNEVKSRKGGGMMSDIAKFMYV